FYGRVAAYDAALDGGEETLEEALIRNHYGTLETVPEDAVRILADYVRAADAHMAAQGVDPLLAGMVDFGPLPRGQETLAACGFRGFAGPCARQFAGGGKNIDRRR